jgi:hypothetical protein
MRSAENLKRRPAVTPRSQDTRLAPRPAVPACGAVHAHHSFELESLRFLDTNPHGTGLRQPHLN